MTRSVKEGNAVTVLQLNIVGSYVLSNTTSLTSNDVGIADVVQERRLTMVNVTHDSNNRSTGNQIVLVVLLLGNSVLHLGRNVLGSKSELVGHDIDGFSVESLVDTYHNTDAHAGTDNLVDTDIHHGSQLRDSDKLCQLQHFRLCCLGSHLFAHALSYGVTLLTTILGTFLVLILRSQTGQRLLNLACYCLVVNLQRFLRGAVLLVLLALSLLLVVALLLTIVIVILLVLLVSLFSGSLDVDLVGTDALTLAAFTGSLFLAFFAALLLRLLLRTRALV